MADDITLKMNVDAADAESSISRFNRNIEKAFSSSNTKIQSMGNSLSRVVNTIQRTANEMERLQNTHVETDEYKALSKELDSLGTQYRKAKDQLDRFKNTTVPTQEYIELQERISFLNDEIKNTEKALKGFEQTDVFKAVSKEVASLERQLGQAEAELQSFQSRGIFSGDEYNAAASQVNILSMRLHDAQVRQQELINTGRQFKDQQAYNDHITMLNIYRQSIDQAELELKNLVAAGQDYKNSDEYNQKIIEVENLRQKYIALEDALKTMKADGSGTISLAELHPEKVEALNNQLAYAVNQGAILSNNINNAGTKTTALASIWKTIRGLISKASSAVKGLGNQTQKTSNTHNTSFKKMLTTVLKYGFGIRSIFLLYKKLRTVISTGLTEMSKQFDDVATDVYELKNSWSGFKASLVSAFQPIFSYVVPALSTLISYLTAAMNAVANFFAILTGQGYYYKASKGIEKVNNGISGSGSAAEEANEELAEYDELIVIDQDSSGGGGGGGGGSSDADAWQWEKVETTASSFADKISKIWDVFKSAWESKGKAVIDAATYAFNSLKELISTVADTIYQVFIDGYGQTWLESVLTVVTSILNVIGDIASAWTKAWTKDNNGYNLVKNFFEMLTSINLTISSIMESWRNAWNDGSGVAICEDILQIISNIELTIKNLSDRFREAWETAGVGDSIMNHILDIVEDITDFINDITEATAEWSKELDFYPLLESIDEVLGSVEGVISSIKEIAFYIYKNIILPLAKKFVESYLPTLLGMIKDDLDTIKDTLDAFDWDTITTAIEKIVELGLDTFLTSVSTNSKLTNDAWRDLTSSAQSLWSIIKDMVDVFKEITGIDFDATNSDLSFFKGLLEGIKTMSNPVTSTLAIVKAAFSGLSIVLEELSTTIHNGKEDLINLGTDIWNGIKEGFQTAWDWTEPIREFFTGIVDKIKEFFGINSPSTEMMTYGEYICEGIIEGFKDKITNIGTAIQEFKDEIVNKAKEKLSNVWDNIKEAIGSFSLSSLLGFDSDNGVIDIVTNITSTFIGGLTSLADFTSLKDAWSTFKEGFKNVSNTIKSKLSGVFSSIADVEDLSTKWKALKDSWKDKSAQLKATLAGKVREIIDIDTITDKYSTLYTTWKNKSADLKVGFGDKLKKITDLDDWRSRFEKLYDAWLSKSATLKAGFGNKLKEITDLDTWKTTFTKLYDAWTDKSADFTTSFDTTLDTLGSWWEYMKDLGSVWYDRSANFALSFSAQAEDLKSWVNTNVIDKINNAFSNVPILNAVSIPRLARGGILSQQRLVMAGEDGAEAIVPLEKNLGWLDKMATMITDKMMNGLTTSLIANGNILPATTEFIRALSSNNEIRNIQSLLEDIFYKIPSVDETSNNNAPILLQIDGKTMARVVWNETEKKYKQVGVRYAY